MWRLSNRSPLLAPPHKGMEIEFKQIIFSYNPSVRVLQKNIDLHLAPGEWGRSWAKGEWKDFSI